MLKTGMIAVTMVLAVAAQGFAGPQDRPRPRALGEIPRTRWERESAGALWTQAALSAMRTLGKPLTATVPADIDQWCPAYRVAPRDQRAKFWVGLISALARHESTWKETAVGGGGKWFGLMQILPATARGYGCRARSANGLMDGSDNLSCAIRIMAVTVPRDGVIATRKGRWRGIAADWGPMTNRAKRSDISRYTRAQKYCRALSSVRPRARPHSGPRARVDRVASGGDILAKRKRSD